MAINEHWGTGFDVNRDPNAGVRKDTVPGEASGWSRPTGKVGAYSAEVHENRSLTHELTIGGILGLGGTHLHVPHGAQIQFLDGRRAQLEDIRELLESLRKRGDRGQRARRLERGALFCERLAQIIEALRDKTEQDRKG